MGRFDDFSIATITFFQTLKKKNIRSRSFGLMTMAVALPLAAGLAGCGGGGGAGAPDISKETGGTPTPTPSTTPGSDNPTTPFVPNYRSDLAAARRWDKSVVTVGFTPPAADSVGAVRNMAPSVQQAVSLWNSKVGQDITFQMVSGSDADVQIKWVDGRTLPSDAIGRTEVRFRNADQVLFAASVSVEKTLPDAYQVQVISHELGHALGIEGHSPSQSDLMYTNAHLPAQITTRDQNTILQAYQGSRALRPVTVSGADLSSSTAVQYVCGAGEFASHKKH